MEAALLPELPLLEAVELVEPLLELPAPLDPPLLFEAEAPPFELVALEVPALLDVEVDPPDTLPVVDAPGAALLPLNPLLPCAVDSPGKPRAVGFSSSIST
ncbi:MAG TPA: hypothetical protein VGH40_23365 [Roseiarcus sp.]